MANSLFETSYNPDVLTCLANLSNDEVFTPPNVVNDMLDMLPQELFSDPTTKFLDPVCKSGVFLREIAKRLIKGLEDKLPDLQERLDHIYHEQLYGIAITELTSFLSRRSLYCSKNPKGKYSISHFDAIQGNIRFKDMEHRFKDGRCVYCGASEKTFGPKKRPAGMESHAYEFIHTIKPEEIWNMKFDVIIGNPPYQMDDGGNGVSASPLYDKFVLNAIKLNPRYLTMIIPSRYFAGGKGLDGFRQAMLNDKRLRFIVDFINAKDCFPQNSISGGVNYFLWQRDYSGPCEITTVLGDSRNTQTRTLNEFPVFIRHNSAIDIVHIIQTKKLGSLSSLISSRNPFGFPTNYRADSSAKKANDDVLVISSKDEGYAKRSSIISGFEYVDSFKVMISRITYEHAGEPGKDGKMRVLSKIRVLQPGEVCTDSYLVVGPFASANEANHAASYLKTKFARFLISISMSSINLSKEKFSFIPLLDFSEDVSDSRINRYFGFDAKQIECIDTMIREWEDAE